MAIQAQFFRGCRNCQKVWKAISPWGQIFGFVIVCAFTAGTYFSQFSAFAKSSEQHDQRLTNLEQNYTRINQKLDDIILFFHVPHKPMVP